VPTHGGRPHISQTRARFLRIDGSYAVYRVPAGVYTFISKAETGHPAG
jgi:hypothetical protein